MLSELKIDINADVAEGVNNEALLMPYLSSCNIACGGHAGDRQIMTKVVRLAKIHNVKIGAHPSFPDRENFGRFPMKISDKDLYENLKFQVENLQQILRENNAELHHLKPHGALYNLAVKNERISKLILDVFKTFSKPVKLYAPYKSVISKLAKLQNIEVVLEGFADRNYNEDLSLVSRQKNNALITDKRVVFEHVFNMVFNQKISTVNGVEVKLLANTICIHGDTKNSSEILKYLHTELKNNNIKIC